MISRKVFLTIFIIIAFFVKSSGQVIAQTNQTTSKIIPHFITWGFWKYNNRAIDTIIIHSSYNPRAKDKYSLEAVLKIYKRFKVAPHYVILRDGSIYQLVDEKDVANHAGISHLPTPPYTKKVSSFSIGIELVENKKYTPTEEQYKSLAELVKDIESRYKIKNILGHKDITRRKTDPWNFDWAKFNAMINVVVK